jgi:hypothetical protein
VSRPAEGFATGRDFARKALSWQEREWQWHDNSPESLVLRHMRDISEKVDCLTSRVAGLEKVLPILVEHVKGLNARVDRVELHLERTYRRLGPIEPSP